MAFDRSKYKGAKRAVNTRESKAVESKLKNSNRPGFLTLKDGINIVRHLPPHNPDHPAYRPKTTVWVTLRDDEGKTFNKPVFNARIHGNWKKDLLEEYSRFAYLRKAEEIDDKEELKVQMYPLNGLYNKKTGQWIYDGIRYNTTYVFYAFIPKTGEIGRIEYYRKEYEVYEKLSLSYSETAEIDPFTDPDEGVSLKLNKVRSKKELTLNIPTRGQEESFYAEQRVSDAVLEKFSKFESLTDLYVNTFQKSDFEYQLQGLVEFEAEYGESHGFDYLNTPEFQAIIEELEGYFDEVVDEETNENLDREVHDMVEENKETEIPTQEEIIEEAEVVSESNDDEFDQMDRDDMLMHIIGNNLKIKVDRKLSDDQLREAIRNYGKAKLVEKPVVEKPVVEKPAGRKLQPKKATPKKSTPKKTVAKEGSSKLQDLKARYARK